MLQPPQFWQREEGARHPIARLLKPVAGIYAKIGAQRIRDAIPYRTDGPVICVGNVSMGGVGKTPFALMIAGLLQGNNFKPAFLTRGYGGKLKGPVIVAETHQASDTGDEAQLLMRQATTCISADREAGARLVFNKDESDVLVMDDGYQNPSLVKDFSVLLIDAETGFGNGEVFPSGPLRETPEAALARAHVVVFVLPSADFTVPDRLVRFAGDLPVFRAWLEAEPASEAGKAVFAFCGIGRPEKFYRSAREAGYTLQGTKDFPDHHAYKPADLASLASDAEKAGVRLLTTEKDFVRLPPDFRDNVKTLPVTMQLDNQPGFVDLMLKTIKIDAVPAAPAAIE